jgi:hypothetical protein
MEEELSRWQQYKNNLGESRPWDLLNPNIARVSEEEAEARLNVCKACPEFIPMTTQCKKCGCIMALKTKLDNATCPLDKWKAQFKAKTIPSFISQEDCKYLVDLVKDTDIWHPVPNSTWDKRSIHVNATFEHLGERAYDIVKDATLRAKEYIEKEYGVLPVFPDIATINRWFPGMSQDPHADDMKNANVPGFEHRAFGSIIYLNTEYEGGHTFYPEHNFEIIPEVGKIAIHPGDANHLHGVTEVKNGMRYTISSFWTYEEHRGVNWSLYK